MLNNIDKAKSLLDQVDISLKEHYTKRLDKLNDVVERKKTYSDD